MSKRRKRPTKTKRLLLRAPSNCKKLPSMLKRRRKRSRQRIRDLRPNSLKGAERPSRQASRKTQKNSARFSRSRRRRPSRSPKD